MNKIGFSGIMILVFVIPWENSIFLPGLGTLSRIFGFVAVLVGVLSIMMGKYPIKVHTFHWIALLFFLLGGSSFFWSLSQERSLIRIVTYLQLIVMIWLIYQFGGNLRNVNILIGAYVVGAYVALANTLWNFAFSEEDWGRFAANGFNPNDMAIILALAIPMAWYIAEILGGWRAWLFRLYPVFGTLGILLTGSRNGALAAVLTLSYPLFTWLKLSFIKKILYATIVVTSIVGVLLIIPDQSLDRIATFSDSINGGMNYRSFIWQAGGESFAKNPILGSGLGTFNQSVESYLGHTFAPHNVYLSILVDLGLVGLLIFLTIIYLCFRAAVGLPTPERRLWLVLLVTWCVCAFALNWETRKQTWLLLVMVVTHCAAFNSKMLPTKRYANENYFHHPFA